MGALRLAWRLQRWELASLIAFVVALVIALSFIGWRMEQIQAEAPECWQRDLDAPLPVATQDACASSFQAHGALREVGSIAAVGATLAPFILGVVLGPPLVGREIEGRTAAIAWTMSRSRGRWLVLRAGPVVALVLVTLAVIGLVGVTLAEQLFGGEPGFGSLVPPLPVEVARGALALAVGLCAGTLIGRTFPAVIATALTIVVLLAAMAIGMDAWMAAEAQPVSQSIDLGGVSKIYQTGLQDTSNGAVMTLTEYYALPGVDETAEVPPAGMTLVAWIVPAADYPIWMWREAAILGGLAVVMAVAFISTAVRRSV